MRAKTIKRLAILIAVLSLVGGTGFFTQQYQVTKLAHTVADRAAQAEKVKATLQRQRSFTDNTWWSYPMM